MNDIENSINWKQLVNEFTSYEGTLISFCRQNNISKGQFYYYRKKFEEKENLKFHAISLKTEKLETQITMLQPKKADIRIEIGAAKIYVPANEIAVLSNLLKDLIENV